MSVERLREALLDGDQNRAVLEAKRLVDGGAPGETIVTEAIEKVMEQLGAKCTVEQFNLLEIMLVGRAVTAVMKGLFPEGAPCATVKGAVVLASLEGDVHDLGKNIVKTVLTAKGIGVIDCGKDCSLDKLIEAAKRDNARFICISGLITSVVPQVRRVKGLCLARGLGQIRVVAGGAALKQSTAQSLNVDYVAENAFDGARYIEEIVEASL
ncbi:MAG: cobalamin-dependent protein [Syntrophobacteraceae bacterium]|nr:cobalamin-dependent protein [Syntrophobacteraceae bacterium]